MINITDLLLTGLFVGVGSALGTYLAQKGLINHLEKVLTKINHKENDLNDNVKKI